MRPRKLGNTNLELSPLAFRCTASCDDQTLRLMACARHHGITFFDLADGPSESLVAYLRTLPRGQIQIATHFPCDAFSPNPRLALDQSLKALATDHIDLYLARHIKLPQFRDDLFADLYTLRDQGKIRAYGLFLGPSIGWRDEGIAAIMDRHADAVQTPFNLFQQDPGREFCDLASACGSAVLATDHDPAGLGQLASPIALQKLAILRQYADAHGLTIRQFACKWLLMHGALASITATFQSEQEIIEAAGALATPPLTMDTLARLAHDYANDWGLGPDARPPDLMSSTHSAGKVPSSYIPPTTMIA